MKNMLLFVVLFVLLQITPASSQVLADYIAETRGDTLVVKSLDDMLGEVNALYNVILLDSLSVPAGRVYELKAGGFYPVQNNPSCWAGRTTIIRGSDPTPVVTNSDPLSFPPLIYGNVGTTTNTGGLSSNGDLVVENCALSTAAPDGSQGWLFTGTGHANERIEYNNCIFEHTLWVEVGAFNAGCTFNLKNCYFVNLVGHGCRRNGGVYDGFANLDTFLVENCTHINTQGSMYKWRNYTANRIIINHNTFVNNSGITFMDLGTQCNASYTNNMFVNANVQPFPNMAGIDDGEKDLDMQPMGLVDVYPDSTLEANSVPRKFYVANNNAYWDPYLANCADTCNQLLVNGKTGWLDQHILMNDRTQAMFDNNAQYPLLTEGINYNVSPGFIDPRDLLSSALVTLKTFSIHTVDTSWLTGLDMWRLVNTGASNFVYYDWPIPVNLAYTNATLLTGAYNSLPVGDLNWFPSAKATWAAQRTAEYAEIQNKLDNPSEDVAVSGNSPVQFKLGQNYPNPFNPSTKIKFTLAKSGYTNLKVIDILGREVATLVSGVMQAGPQEVQFNAANLASGVYFYKLTSGNFTDVKKMMLVK
jgi:hypothetical protein